MKLWQMLDALRPVRFDEPVAVLDLETSGLDPRSDRILAVAAVRVDGHRIGLHDRFHHLVQDDGPVNPSAIRHHRLRPLDLRDGAPMEQILAQLIDWIGPRPLVGFATAFDLHFLKRHARAQQLQLPRRHADVRELFQRRARRRNPDAPLLGFEQIAAQLGIPVVGRHDALGDAVTTALMWLSLAQQR